MLAASIVLAARDAAGSIRRCLEAVTRQPGPGGVEVIVASCSTDETDAIVRREFPSVRLLHFDEPLTVPELRARAIAESRGRIVIVIDPFSIPADDWLAGLLEAHATRPEPVIGGPVDLADADRRNLLEWAIYINEYGMFLPPMASGTTEILPGSNIAYKRQALFDGDRPRHPLSFWKTFVNQAVAGDGGSGLYLTASAVVALDKPIPFRDFLRSRYDHGRCFAGMRAGRTVERALRALTTPVLPVVFLWRWGRRYWPRARYRRMLVATLPLQLLLFANWARGEFMGYVFGPGTSCRKLFY